jgi:DNA polymerase V
MRVEGESMRDAGVHSGDIVVIDKGLEPSSGDMVVAFLDGEFTLKTFKRDGSEGWLMPANDAYEPIKVSDEGQDFQIWGVVTYTIHAQHS